MKNLNILITILILFFFISCNRDNRGFFDETPYKVKVDNVVPQLVELDKSLPTPFYLKEVKRVETPLGGYPMWVKTPKENELILLYADGEKGGHGVLFYDNELNLTKRKIIKKGEGPGEADIPIMVGSKEKLYLINKLNQRLTTFDHDLNILKEKRYKLGPGYVEGFALYMIKDNTEILHCFNLWKYKLRHGNRKRAHASYAMRTMNIKNLSINILRSEDIMNDTNKRSMTANIAHWVVHNDFIFFVDLKDYIISKMDFNGKVLKKIKIKHKEKEFSQEQSDEWIKQAWGDHPITKKWSYPKKLYPVAFILEIKDGFAIGRREDYSPKEIEYITADYFTWGMEFKGKINIPYYKEGALSPVASGFRSEANLYYKEPYFYTIKQEEEADFIIKWEIMEESKENGNDN